SGEMRRRPQSIARPWREYLTKICRSLKKTLSFPEIKFELCARSGNAGRADEPVVVFHDATADREPDARPGILIARVQPLEQIEDTFSLMRRKANAVVLHLDLVEPFGAVGIRHTGHLHPR